MAPPRIVLGAVVLIALTVACTRPEVTAITEPLAPPDTLTPLTTTSTQAPTTTTLDVERAAVYPVDPMTLEPLAGFDPIPTGDWYDWYWAAISSNQKWLAINVGSDDGTLDQVRLINLKDWETAAKWYSEPYGSALGVLDDGTVYTVTQGPSSPQLSRLAPGAEQPEQLAQLPLGSWWYGPFIDDQRAAILGVNSVNGVNEATAALAIVDLETGAVNEIELPEVKLGTVTEVEIGEDFPGVVTADPGLVWDAEGPRILVVHAERDTVTEVDVVSGQVIEHQFGSEAWDWGPLYTGPSAGGGGVFVSNRRTAALSGDRRSLYVATTIGDFEVTNAGWSANTNSTGIVTIDTETWQIVDRLDAPLSDIQLSPDGARLLATGYNSTEGMDIYEPTNFGLYVINAEDLKVVAQYEPESSDVSYGGFSFTDDSRLGYATAWGQQVRVHVIDLETGAMLTTRDGDSHVFGRVGVLAAVDQTS